MTRRERELASLKKALERARLIRRTASTKAIQDARLEPALSSVKELSGSLIEWLDEMVWIYENEIIGGPSGRA